MRGAGPGPIVVYSQPILLRRWPVQIQRVLLALRQFPQDGLDFRPRLARRRASCEAGHDCERNAAAAAVAAAAACASTQPRRRSRSLQLINCACLPAASACDTDECTELMALRGYRRFLDGEVLWERGRNACGVVVVRLVVVVVVGTADLHNKNQPQHAWGAAPIVHSPPLGRSGGKIGRTSRPLITLLRAHWSNREVRESLHGSSSPNRFKCAD